jgi:hypothetical protein
LSENEMDRSPFFASEAGRGDSGVTWEPTPGGFNP